MSNGSCHAIFTIVPDRWRSCSSPQCRAGPRAVETNGGDQLCASSITPYPEPHFGNYLYSHWLLRIPLRRFAVEVNLDFADQIWRRTTRLVASLSTSHSRLIEATNSSCLRLYSLKRAAGNFGEYLVSPVIFETHFSPAPDSETVSLTLKRSKDEEQTTNSIRYRYQRRTKDEF